MFISSLIYGKTILYFQRVHFQLLCFGSTPHPVTVANEGLGWDSLLKMVHNPGGDWNPGWGVDLSYVSLLECPQLGW